MNDDTLRSSKILMLDDEISGLCLMENVLNRLGFKNIRKLTDSTAFFAEFASWLPDLIITDLEMPKLDGFQVLEQVRASLPPNACLPILVLTGSRDSSAKRKALVAGATDILFKPFDSSELLMRLRSMLRMRHQHLEIQDQNQALEKAVAERTASLQKALTDLETSQRRVVQQERLRAFGEMASGVVHDFNNSLMSIIGYSELLLQDPSLLDDREMLLEYLKTINVAGRDSAHVVSRLRDFYRPREESDLFAAVDVNELLEAVVPLTKPKWHHQALESGRTIRMKLELQKVPFLFGNGSDLREVFTNLIFNAVDALPQGGTITIRTFEKADSTVVELVDTGTGMSEEVRQRCLEPFFTTKAEQGTGLGLAMVFGIIRRHDGNLEIDSAPGRGTTIRIIFPRHEPSNLESAEPRLMLDRSLRVLAVDDEPAARDIVMRYLRGDGHKVTCVAGAREAMAQVLSEEFDVVITDHGMPGMNGMQLADALRRLDLNMPVILLTGFGITPDAKPDSVRCVLQKPIGPAALRNTLREVFGQ